MLDRDLDLEADLRIDSIKRTEILGELAERLALTTSGAGLDEQTLAELSARKTLQAIVTWVIERTISAPLASAAPTNGPAKPAAIQTTPPPRRWRPVPPPINPPTTLVPPHLLPPHPFSP